MKSGASTEGAKLSKRLTDLTDTVLFWPLKLVERMEPGPLKFVASILVLPMAFPCIFMAMPFMFATFIVEVWEESNT